MIKINIDEHREKVGANLQNILKEAALDVIKLHNAEKELMGHVVVVTLKNGMVFTEANHETDQDKAVQDAMLHINNRIFEMEYYRVAQNAAEADETV